MKVSQIQKIISKENELKPEIDEEKAFLKSKRARGKSKPKVNSQKPKKRQRKKLAPKKKKKEKPSKIDDISLETISTINTFDEETNPLNLDMLKYSDDIKFMLEDLYSRGIYFKNMTKFTNSGNDTGLSQEKNLNVKFSNENLENHINSLDFSQKINLILDIDETLVFSEMIKVGLESEESSKIFEAFKNDEQNNIYYAKVSQEGRYIIYRIQIRKNMAQFFKELSPYCNFYINSMAHPLYVKEVLKILNKNYFLDPLLIRDIFYTPSTNRKRVPEEIEKDGNFLILDDNLCAWELCYIPSIIPTQKFRNDEKGVKNVFYQYYLFSNKIYCYDEVKRPFLDKRNNNIPYCVETQKNEMSQLLYIIEIIKKSLLLSKIIEIPIRHCFHFFQNMILKNCRIYYDGYDNNFILDIINLIGGIFTKNIKDATHILVNGNIINNEKDLFSYEDKHVLDIKWIFDCFFYFKKFDEYEGQYKLR